VFQASEASVDGDILQNNDTGLTVNSASKVRLGGLARPLTIQGNGTGIFSARQGFVFIIGNVQNNSGQGIFVRFHSTLELAGGSVSNNGSIGAKVLESSDVRFTGGTIITANGGPGVQIEDLSMSFFNGATVTGNGGGTDVVCTPQFSATRGVAGTGGTTNCVEP
jgi:hypothetical protein